MGGSFGEGLEGNNKTSLERRGGTCTLCIRSGLMWTIKYMYPPLHPLHVSMTSWSEHGNK